MGEEQIKQLLKDFGLTDTETEVYLFLSKQGALKGTEIAKRIKKDKAQIYHILRSLQTKGLVESTLEAPVRFAPVAFESVVESTIKAKKDEAQRIETTKNELLSYWKSLNKQKTELPLEKFSVIEGKQRIYTKIGEMVQNAQNKVSTVATVPNLLRANESEIYESLAKNPPKTQIQFQFLTSLHDQNDNSFSKLQNLWSKTSPNAEFRTPDLGQRLFPEMVIADNKETVFFIANDTENSQKNDDICLWTNSKSLTQAFSLIFENLWLNATNIQNQKGKKPQTQSKSYVISTATEAEKKYQEALCNAEKDIIISTSSKGLSELQKFASNRFEKNRISAKIMVPITNANLKEVQELSRAAQVKHVRPGYIETTIIDGTHLFQFTHSLNEKENKTIKDNLRYKGVLYSTDFEYVKNISNQLESLWENASFPSANTLQVSSNPKITASEYVVYEATKKMQNTTSLGFEDVSRSLTEKDIVDKILKAQRYPPTPDSKGIVKTYGVNCQAIVRPPSNLNLPDLLFHVYHLDKHSTYGTEDVIIIHPWIETRAGFAFVLSALITDNAEAVEFWRKASSDSPATNNVQLFNKDDLEVYVHGTTLFAGWTKPIPIMNSWVIPPSYLQIEGHGITHTSAYSLVIPSGYTLKTEGNHQDAFVTYVNSSLKYSGPGTDGAFGRDIIIEFYPPQKQA